jgi:hypothetical protein
MIIEMTASAIISLGGVPSHGASDTASFVAAQTNEGRRLLQKSYAFGMEGKGVFDELFHTLEESREPNWDGYGAQPLSEQVYHFGQQFLEALPLGTPRPSIGAEPDGHLTIEWYRSPRRTLSVSISPDGDLHYAALLGDSKAYGTEPFFGEAPKAIVDLIHRVMAA